MRVPAVHAWGDRLLKRVADRIIGGERANRVMLIDYIGQGSIAQVDLHIVPESLKDVPLSQTGLKQDNNILVMLVEVSGGKADPPTADTVFKAEDRLTVFGDYNTICRVFEARERFEDEGEEAEETPQKKPQKPRKMFE